LVVGPRRILGIPVPEIKQGATANFVLFNLQAEWELNSDTNKSKSSNSPFWGSPLKGKVEFVYNNYKFLKI
jgi:dihydroorotase